MLSRRQLIHVAPELEILDALQDLLALTALTLFFAHPDLALERSQMQHLHVEASLADRVLLRAADLADAITEYESVVLATLDELGLADDADDADIPF